MQTTPEKPHAIWRNLAGCVLLALSVLPAWAVGPNLPEPPPFVEKLATRENIAQLRKGGYVLYVRHGYTDNTRPDQFPNVDLNDCNTQRLLSDEGRALMKKVGQSFKTARIPVGDIRVSPMCRTQESATLAFGPGFSTAEPLMYSANMTSEEKRPRLAALGKILNEPVPAGTNRVLVAHAPNLADLIGFFVKPEGTVVIFAQRGENGYEYVASIHPGMWPELTR